MQDWLNLLRKECERATQAAVARRLGLSAPTVSLVLSGKYRGGTARIAARVNRVLGRVWCPWLDREITALECTGNRGQPVPTANPDAVRFWGFCQDCTAWRSEEGGRG